MAAYGFSRPRIRSVSSAATGHGGGHASLVEADGHIEPGPFRTKLPD